MDDGGSQPGIASLTGKTFDDLVLQASGPIAVEFMSYSCSFCGAIEPALQQAAEKLKSRQKIFRVNIVVEADLARSFDIQGTPTFVLFRDGSEVGRVEGPSPDLSSLLAELTRPFAA